MNHFRSGNILIPENCDLQKWAVIACDQYTSEPEYWKKVRDFVADDCSTLHVFFPEADLGTINRTDYHRYWKTMVKYLSDGVLKEYPDSIIYVERTLESGQIRQGIVGMIDLEYYDYAPKADTKIFATEETVLQRVPPRVALRSEAALEFSHTVMFCDDPTCSIVESVGKKREMLPKLYDFDLMFGGGHIAGYLLNGEDAQVFENLVSDYELNNAYLVGDGNHSLVTAKLSYEALKGTDPDVNWAEHPARYAMVELENIHSPAMLFEPIYRIAVCDDPGKLIWELKKLDDPEGTPVTWIRGNLEGTVRLKTTEGELLIEALQRFLDRCVPSDGSVDYIHGADSVRSLAQDPDTVGFLLPDMEKSILFPYVLSGKVMPKKTFSIGHASEKRYYLEGRKIK